MSAHREGSALEIPGSRFWLLDVDRRVSRKPLFFLALLGVLFFGDLVVHPDQVLYSKYSDLIPLHLPARRFLARSWKETGTVPLWCPYNLGGMPFIQDVQSSAFYPLHWPLLWLPEQHQGAALSWLIVLHVILAGWLMYGYARSRGLGPYGAFVAGLGYMFAGKWLLHLLAGGHYNMVPLAWLPLVVWCLERAVRKRSLLWATWAGAAYSLIILGAYPYITLYAGLFIGLWTLGTVLEADTVRGGLPRWLSFGMWTAAVAVVLGAVQLWPSMEAARLASRTLGVPTSADTFTGGLWALVGLIGPPLTKNPDWLWENRTGLGIIWVALAALGVRLGGRRARVPVIACVMLLVFACGGAAVCQNLPGFRLFQLPSRMLLLLAFPVTLLAGMAVDRLTQAGALPLSVPERWFALKMIGVPLFLLGPLAIALHLRGEQLAWHSYWVSLLVTLPAVVWLLRRRAAGPGWRFGCTVVLLIDLWGVGLPLVQVRSEAEVFAPSACVRWLMQHRQDHGRVLDVAPVGASTNDTPLWPGLPAVLGIEPVRGFNPVDVLRYKEYLQFLTDRDQPLRPLDRMFTSAVLGGFPIKNEALADMLGVRYLVQPRDMPLANTVPDAQARRQWQRVCEDPSPSSFNFIPATATGTDCGLRSLPPYCVYENQHALPRAFVVPEASPLPVRAAVLKALKSTNFRQRVFLEDWTPEKNYQPAGGQFHAAILLTYQPNRVVVGVDGAAGYLVLTDVWFPGWRCTVDGMDTPLYRADFLFRAVRVPAGRHTIVFRFEPLSFQRGKLVSLGGCLLLACTGIVGLGRRFARKKQHAHEPNVIRILHPAPAIPAGHA